LSENNSSTETKPNASKNEPVIIIENKPPVVSSGATEFMSFFAWIYLIASIITGIVFIVQCGTSSGHDDGTYLGGIGFGIIIQGILIFSFLSVLVHLCKNVARITEILESKE